MQSHNDGLKPSRAEYKDFETDLSKQSSKKSIETGLTIFLAMLFFIPLIGLLLAIASGLLETGLQIRILIRAVILSGLAIIFMFQAYAGLVKQDVRVLPKSRVRRSESGYMGGKVSERVTGKNARIVGSVFMVGGVVCLGVAIWMVVGAQ